MTDKTTGLSQKEIPARLAQIVAAGKAVGEPWRITKAKCFAAQVLEESIDVSPLDWFPAIAVWDRNSRPITKVTKGDRTTKGERALEVNAAALPEWVKKEWTAGNADGTWNMWQDFDHSVPDWRVILKLGFPGLKARLEVFAGEWGTGNREWGTENRILSTKAFALLRTQSLPASTGLWRRERNGLGKTLTETQMRRETIGKNIN